MIVSEVLGILGFIISLVLAIRTLFFENKSRIKITISFAIPYPGDYIKYTDTVTKESCFIVFTFTNIGNVNVNLQSCGCLLSDKTKFAFLNEALSFNPIGTSFPYKVDARNKFEAFYPVETYFQIPKEERLKITHLYVNSASGKRWKRSFRKYLEMLENVKKND